MQVSITMRHFKASDNLKEYVEKEVKRLQKIFDRIVDCQVILDRGKEGEKVDIVLNVSGHTFNASETSDDMIKSIDYAVNKMEKQLRRYKEKITR